MRLNDADDLISRQAAIEIVRHRCKRLTTACVLAVTEIEQLPSAQPLVRTEMSSADCISRQQAVDALTRTMVSIPTAGGKDLMGDVNRIRAEDISVIKRLPSAQTERKTGRWIRHIRTDLGPKLNDTIECSECRIAFPTENMFRRSFCPNCGSYNRGESDG